MKNLFNSLIVLFLALSYTMAELVPNCSHVLHFSDEEVECLQKVIQNRSEDLYAFYADQADPNILIKYPPHCVNKNINDTHAIIISNKQGLFSLFFCFFNKASQEFSWQQCDFAYTLLVATNENLIFPPYNSQYQNYYHTVVFCLHRLLQYFEYSENIFPEFYKNRYSEKINKSEINSIFEPIGIPAKPRCCIIQ